MRIQLAIAALYLALGSVCVAADDDVRWSISSGVDYTSGDYGGPDVIEDTYVPVTAKMETGRLGFRLTVPYLSVRAPSGTVIIGPGGEPVAGTGPTRTESGLGDIIAGVTLYDALRDDALGLALDLTGKVKFGTANEDKGLGTGEHDYSVQADLYKFVDDVTLLVSAGYKVRGDPSGIDLENVLFGSIGGLYRLTAQTRTGLIFDYRESAFSGGDSVRELTGFVSQRVGEHWRVQFNLLTGFSDASPEWGGGLKLKYEY